MFIKLNNLHYKQDFLSMYKFLLLNSKLRIKILLKAILSIEKFDNLLKFPSLLLDIFEINSAGSKTRNDIFQQNYDIHDQTLHG